MEWMIVHRNGAIYRLRFKLEEIDEHVLIGEVPELFQSIKGWDVNRVMTWLDEHDYDYYWESSHD